MDISPKAVRQPHRKAPAPPIPTSTNQLPPAATQKAGHQRSHSGNDILVAERPSVPPPLPPRSLEEGNVMNGSDRFYGDRQLPTDAESRTIVDTIGGSKQAVADGGIALRSDGTMSEHSSVCADVDLGLGMQFADTSSSSDRGDASWYGESSATVQPKEDIRKMTAQLKEQWWHDSPTPDRSAASKMAAIEISGLYNPRVSPSPSDNTWEDQLEKRSSANDVCDGKLDSVDSKSPDSSDGELATVDVRPDTVDADADNSTLSELDAERRDVKTEVELSEHYNSSDSKSHDVVDIDTGVPQLDITSGETAHGGSTQDADGRIAGGSTDADEPREGIVKFDVESPKSGIIKPCPKADLQVDVREAMPTSSSVSPPPPVRPKPLKSPPARIPSFTGSSKGCVEPRRSLSLREDNQPSRSPSVSPPGVSPIQRVKPPPPAPKSPRSRPDETAVKPLKEAGSSAAAVFGEDVATQDEDTYL